eukprot:SAG22_NODE_133_length_18379_cov_34.571937_12_plen_112_part_00
MRSQGGARRGRSGPRAPTGACAEEQVCGGCAPRRETVGVESVPAGQPAVGLAVGKLVQADRASLPAQPLLSLGRGTDQPAIQLVDHCLCRRLRAPLAVAALVGQASASIAA